MDLRNIREIKRFSAERLAQSPSQQKIVLIYAGLTLGLAALVAVAGYVLGLQIDNYGGLSNLSKRTMLSSVQSMLPVLLSLVTLCLDLGYFAAMLRVARGMYTSPQTLRLGFDRFWLLLRCNILRGLVLMGVMFSSMYFGIMIFMMTPFSRAAVEIVTPLMSQMSVLNTGIVIDDATYLMLMEAMLPGFAICGILALAVGGPVYYSYRMVEYVVIDKPAIGAMKALRESKKMMRGHRREMLKLDLSFWWYYLGAVAVTVIGYGDVILPMLGLELPVSGDAAYFIFYALYLAGSFALYYFLRNRLVVCCALAYDAVKPQKQKDDGVILGNIFQM